LEDKRSEDDKMFRRVQETVEIKAREVRMAEIEERRRKEEKEAEKLEAKAKKLVPEKFHK